MVFKYYNIDNSVWEEYFLQQAKNGRKKEVSQQHLFGGIDNNEETEPLSIVGEFKKKSRYEDPVTIKVTSPASSTVEMAKDEIENIKEHAQKTTVITSNTLGRKRGQKSAQTTTRKKKKINNNHKDIFSKQSR